MAVNGKVSGEVLRGKAQIPGLIPGEKGENGESAYEIAKRNGFEGTEQEWLASLKGKDGKDGAQGDKGDGIPPISATDANKVLTANEDGTAGWKEPKGGLSVTEITSPEEITADSPDGFYIQEGGSSAPSGGTTIHYYDSLEAAEAANLPEGSFVAVPSTESGGGGLPTVELTTPITADTVFTDAENAALTEAYESGMPIVLKCSLNYTGTNVDGAGVELVADALNTIATAISMGGAKYITVNYVSNSVLLISEETAWVVVVE